MCEHFNQVVVTATNKQQNSRPKMKKGRQIAKHTYCIRRYNKTNGNFHQQIDKIRLTNIGIATNRLNVVLVCFVIHSIDALSLFISLALLVAQKSGVSSLLFARRRADCDLYSMLFCSRL